MLPEPIQVLLIEDNPGDIDLLRLTLPAAFDAGMKIYAAATLQQGEALLAEHHVDLVLLDLSLPDSQGLSTLDRVIAAAPYVPVVVMTGTTNHELGLQAINRGAQDFLVKGQVDIDLITRSMRYAIERKRAEETERQQRLLAEALLDTATILTSTLDLNEVLDRILDHVKGVVPNDGALITLFDAAGKRLTQIHGDKSTPEMRANAARLEHRLEDAGFIEQFTASEQPIIVTDAPVTGLPGGAPPVAWMHSWLGVPIRLRNETKGFIVLMGRQPDFFGETEAARLQAFASHAAIAIENAQRFNERERAVAEATTELRQTVEHLRAILNSSPDAVLMLDPAGRIDRLNHAFLRLFDYRDEPTDGPQLADLFHRDSREAVAEALAAAVEGRETVRLEAIAQSARGKLFDVNLAMSPIEENGSLLGVVCILRDISDLKAYDRLRDAFVATAAHELRTPLTSIRGFSELLLSRDLDADSLRRYLGYINKQAVALGHIVGDLLDLSLFQSGRRLELDIKPVNVGEVVEQVISNCKSLPSTHTLVVEGFEDLPLVPADRARLAQVIRNLLSNTIKFSPEDSTTRVWARLQPGSVAINVEDEGIGLTEEQQQRVFDQFYRADLSDSGLGGTGLGLTISRIIVEAHGGHLSVESTPGEGSTFKFNIPLYAADTDQSS